jgi:DNA-binding transcriptional ArsR family regulator
MTLTSDETDSLDATFAALADPTRRAILRRLTSGEASVGELGEPFSMTQPAISKHLKVLETAGLISRRPEAQRRLCRIEPAQFQQATQWLLSYREFWTGSFVELDTLLTELQSKEGGS